MKDPTFHLSPSWCDDFDSEFEVDITCLDCQFYFIG